MSAMEQMIVNLFRAMGFDPEAIKTEVNSRVKNFEESIARLNEHLAQINSRLAAIETHLGVPPNDTNTNQDNRSDEPKDRDARSSEPRLDPAYDPPRNDRS